MRSVPNELHINFSSSYSSSYMDKYYLDLCQIDVARYLVVHGKSVTNDYLGIDKAVACFLKHFVDSLLDDDDYSFQNLKHICFDFYLFSLIKGVNFIIFTNLKELLIMRNVEVDLSREECTEMILGKPRGVQINSIIVLIC